MMPTFSSQFCQDWALEIVLMDKRDFVRFELKTGLVM